MLEVIIACFVSTFVITSYGKFFISLTFSNNFQSNLNISEKGLIGIIVISFLGLLVNFVLPLNQILSSTLFIIGIILGVKYRIYLNKEYLIITSLISFILIIYSNVNRPDAGLYHLPITSILNESKIIIGLTNIHFRFGHGSLIQYLSALHNTFFFNISFLTIPLVTVFSIYIFFIYKKIVFFFKDKNTTLSLLYLIFFVIGIYAFNRYSAYGNDASAHIFYFYFYLKLLEIFLKQNLTIDKFFFLFLIAIFLSTLKVFMIISIIPLLYLFLKIKSKITIFKNLKFYLFLSLFTMFLIKSILISGCMFFPIKNSCFDSLKIFNEAKTIETARVSEAWAKGWPDKKNSNSSFKKFNKDFNWFLTWKNNHLLYIYEKLLPILLFLLITYIYVMTRTNLGNKNYLKLKRDTKFNILFLFLFTGFTVVLWLIKFPLYRFGFSFLITFIVLIFFISIKDKLNYISVDKLRNFFIILVIISLSGLTLKNINRISHDVKVNQVWPNIEAKEKFSKVYLNNKGFYYFSRGKQCMYSNSPCTYYKTENLKFEKVFSYSVYWEEE